MVKEHALRTMLGRIKLLAPILLTDLRNALAAAYVIGVVVLANVWKDSRELHANEVSCNLIFNHHKRFCRLQIKTFVAEAENTIKRTLISLA